MQFNNIPHPTDASLIIYVPTYTLYALNVSNPCSCVPSVIILSKYKYLDHLEISTFAIADA